MYKLYNIICDCCSRCLFQDDYLIVKGRERVLHYCNEECKSKHYHEPKSNNEKDSSISR